MNVFDFLKSRDMGQIQLFPQPGNTAPVVLISSHIWWTELIAHSLFKLGYSVLCVPPWYSFYTSDDWFSRFDEQFNNCLQVIRQCNVRLIIGGNSTAMVLHPQRLELLHQAARAPLVNFWWDELRTLQPLHRRGITNRQYLSALTDEKTLNVIWDVDVLEELREFYGLSNAFHVPLGTTPEFWPIGFMPMEQRQTKACFLGNLHGTEEGFAPPGDLLRWSSQVLTAKAANPDRPMAECASAAGEDVRVGPDASDERLAKEFQRWNILSMVHMLSFRNNFAKALAEHLGDGLTIVGKGWEKMGLTAKATHSGVPKAAEYYANAKASLNLFGGCVHGGMPLRPYEIACSYGLIFTQYTRELPHLFEPGKECVAFANLPQMIEAIDHIQSHPQDFNPMIHAARARVIAEHTWEHRMASIMRAASERFGIDLKTDA